MIGLNISWGVVDISFKGRFFSLGSASASGVDGGGGTSTGEMARAQQALLAAGAFGMAKVNEWEYIC